MIILKKRILNNMILEINYFKIYEHRTNNACESCHHILNSKFNSKPSVWKFINMIRNEENELKIEINSIKNGDIP